MPAIAYSYIRFSSTAQADGDSLRRQTEGAESLCKRKGWTLDTAFSVKDLGVSAFRGRNAAVGNFRIFLDAIKSGHVRPGSVLVVESFDRISRQGIDEGYDLIKSILKAGIRIATLSPEREFDKDATRSLSKGALEIQLILERAAEESETKSNRLSKARARDRERARNGEVITKRVPSWLVVEDGKIKPDPDKLKIVKRLVQLALDGQGLTGRSTRAWWFGGLPRWFTRSSRQGRSWASTNPAPAAGRAGSPLAPCCLTTTHASSSRSDSRLSKPPCTLAMPLAAAVLRRK
jgi:DNA invertase Pin-like site-specific DNA recombinase